jgi:PDZ domain-containing protein
MVQRGSQQQPLTITLGTRAAAAAAVEQNPGEAPPAAPTFPPLTSPGPPSPSLGSPTNAAPVPASPVTAQPAPATDSTAAAAPIRSRPLDLGAPPAEAPAEPAFAAPADALPTPAPAISGGASLGITVVALTEDLRAAYGLTVRRGALITGLRPGSPAERAGLPIGGAVVAIDGRRIDSADDLVASVRAARPGQEVELTYYEGERLGRKTVRLAAAGPATAVLQPPPPPPAREGPLGLSAPGGNDRPLFSRVERMIDNVATPRGLSTVYNPADMAALQSRMAELIDQIRGLEERLKAIETKVSGAAAPSAPPFGAGLAPAGTNP